MAQSGYRAIAFSLNSHSNVLFKSLCWWDLEGGRDWSSASLEAQAHPRGAHSWSGDSLETRELRLTLPSK